MGMARVVMHYDKRTSSFSSRISNVNGKIAFGYAARCREVGGDKNKDKNAWYRVSVYWMDKRLKMCAVSPKQELCCTLTVCGERPGHMPWIHCKYIRVPVLVANRGAGSSVNVKFYGAACVETFHVIFELDVIGRFIEFCNHPSFCLSCSKWCDTSFELILLWWWRHWTRCSNNTTAKFLTTCSVYYENFAEKIAI